MVLKPFVVWPKSGGLQCNLAFGFSKFVPKPLEMLKEVFLAPFVPVVTHFGPWKVPECLENGPFWGGKWARNVRFQKWPWTF